MWVVYFFSHYEGTWGHKYFKKQLHATRHYIAESTVWGENMVKIEKIQTED